MGRWIVLLSKVAALVDPISSGLVSLRVRHTYSILGIRHWLYSAAQLGQVKVGGNGVFSIDTLYLATKISFVTANYAEARKIEMDYCR